MIAKFALTAVFICIAYASYTQDNVHNNAFWNDANGRPLKLNTGFRTEGSPFLYDDYRIADIHAANGQQYKGIKVKLNLAENSILYLSDKNEEMIAEIPIKKIVFNGIGNSKPVTLISTRPVLNEKGAPVFEVLVDGTAKLLKKLTISYTDTRPYNEASVVRTYIQNNTLYAQTPNAGFQLQKIAKRKTDLLDLFSDKLKQIQSYMESNKLSCRNEKEIILVFEHYNTL
jgi:hypothetical protein